MNYKDLKDLCLEVVDCPHSTPTWTDTGKIVIRNFNIKNGFIDLSDPSYTDDEHFRQRIKRAVPKPGDVVITREAPMGEVGMIPEGVECCLGQRMVLLRVNPKVCDNYYLLYCLQTEFVQRQISWSQGTGTTVSNLRIPHLEKLQIPYVSIEEQKRVCNVIRSVENNIRLNNSIIRNIQDQAQALFDSWFLKFEPFLEDGTTETEIGSIPKNWKLCNLGSVTMRVNDRVKDASYKVLSAVNTGNLQLSEEYFTKQVYSKSIEKYIIVNEGDFAYNPARVNIGSIGINDLGFVGCVSPVYVVFRVGDGYQHFFDFFLKSERFKKEVSTRAVGSVRQSLNYNDFSLIKIVYPPREVVKEFNIRFLKMKRYMEQKKEENERLWEMRSALIPHLIDKRENS